MNFHQTMVLALFVVVHCTFVSGSNKTIGIGNNTTIQVKGHLLPFFKLNFLQKWTTPRGPSPRRFGRYATLITTLSLALVACGTSWSSSIGIPLIACITDNICGDALTDDPDIERCSGPVRKVGLLDTDPPSFWVRYSNSISCNPDWFETRSLSPLSFLHLMSQGGWVTQTAASEQTRKTGCDLNDTTLKIYDRGGRLLRTLQGITTFDANEKTIIAGGTDGVHVLTRTLRRSSPALVG